MDLDTSLYPDLATPPSDLLDDEGKADYVARVCAAWDFGIFPEPQTLALLAGWQRIFERFVLQESPAYHVLCDLFGFAHRGHGRIFRAHYEVLDAAESRSDPFHGRI